MTDLSCLMVGKRYQLVRSNGQAGGIFRFIGLNPVSPDRGIIVWERWQLDAESSLDGSADNLFNTQNITPVPEYHCEHCRHVAEGRASD